MTHLLAILNTTPDSFSDGGKHNTPTKALKKALQLLKDGVDIIDIGGQSTAPNAPKISTAEELARTIPIIKALRAKTKAPISIDTTNAQVAQKALQAGATIINDVSALRADRRMASVAAKANCQIILMYSKDSKQTTIHPKQYRDIIQTIAAFFTKRIAYAKAQGINPKNIILDPGLGHFISADPKYSYEIIARLPELKAKFPKHKFLLGISRKSFLGGPIEERDNRGLPLQILAAHLGADYLRTHEVKELKNQLP